MSIFSDRGNEIRSASKALVLDFMQSDSRCQIGAEGMRLSLIFRECGFDWGGIRQQLCQINNIGLEQLSKN